MTRHSTLHILQSTRNWIAEPSKLQKDLSSDITLEQHIPSSTNWLIIMQFNCPQLGFFDACHQTLNLAKHMSTFQAIYA